MDHRLIVTGASEVYAASVLALIGSIRCNWPAHPHIVVYDLGLSAGARDAIRRCGASVRDVAEFCPHWRQHFAWKIWAWNDAPCTNFLWIDAGIVVLEPLDEIFERLSNEGLFVVPTYHLLNECASEQACEGVGVPPDFRNGRMTFAGGFIAFRREGRIAHVLADALRIASVERFIASTHPRHRHDQMVISLLIHRDLAGTCPADGLMYAGWIGPDQVPGQKVWVHRRRLLWQDVEHLQRCAQSGGTRFVPTPLPQPSAWRTAWKAVFAPTERVIRRLLRGQPLRADSVPYDGVRKR